MANETKPTAQDEAAAPAQDDVRALEDLERKHALSPRLSQAVLRAITAARVHGEALGRAAERDAADRRSIPCRNCGEPIGLFCEECQ